MRQALNRAVVFGLAGAAAIVIVQVALLILYPKAFTSPIEIVVIRHFEAAAVAGSILTCGALIGFAAVGDRLASAGEAMALGAITGIPATLFANVVVGSLGNPGAIAVAAFLAAVVAYLGGGGLRSGTSQGILPAGAGPRVIPKRSDP